jgi:hypothetical protein
MSSSSGEEGKVFQRGLQKDMKLVARHIYRLEEAMSGQGHGAGTLAKSSCPIGGPQTKGIKTVLFIFLFLKYRWYFIQHKTLVKKEMTFNT